MQLKKPVNAVKTGLSATVAVGVYIGDHAERGDMQGVVRDAQKTGQAIGHVASEVGNHLSHMKAHDIGKFVGHDVLPGVVAAVVVPELAGEGIALAASAASKLGIVVKEVGAIDKVAGLYEHAASKISSNRARSRTSFIKESNMLNRRWKVGLATACTSRVLKSTLLEK